MTWTWKNLGVAAVCAVAFALSACAGSQEETRSVSSAATAECDAEYKSCKEKCNGEMDTANKAACRSGCMKKKHKCESS